MLTAKHFLDAARCPRTLPEFTEFGLWTLRRIDRTGDHMLIRAVGCAFHTVLHRMNSRSLMRPFGEIVMDDSNHELRKHLPIMMTARGHVLVSGLGLGCVVRGLLANPRVERITVLEIDKDIIRICGAEFAGTRADIIQTDALQWSPAVFPRFDYAWHDIHDDGDDLQVLHGQLLVRYEPYVDGPQGAWAFPREFKRIYGREMRMIGGARHPDCFRPEVPDVL